jgi:urea transporter/murein DD-endopeptidase MepM/ murein hydrolase activator NlpD
MFKNALHTLRTVILPAVLNSYSVIFFLNNRFFASVLMLVTFFNFFAGFCGLLAVVTTVLLAYYLNLDKIQLKKGLFSFNALLLGIGMGTFFDPSPVFFLLLFFAALLALILTITLGGSLNKLNLPVLSIPFVLSFWFVLIPADKFENFGLTQRNIYWLNEMYNWGGNTLLNFFQTLDTLPVNNLIDIYLRSMSSIFFQSNLISGLLIVCCLIICSRIAFSLSVLGFLSAWLFTHFTGSGAAGFTYYNIGANYIMVALGIGGFFCIPSRYSYLWSFILVPLTTILVLFFNKLLGYFALPVFSLPFSLIVILFLYFLQFRFKTNRLILTISQYYLPEDNLYNYEANIKSREKQFRYFPFHLPFWGEWNVSQAHDGEHTHKGEWSNAFDFIIMDEKQKSHSSEGLKCEDFYCYNKPVLAPANGYVEDIIDNIDDNEIGTVNNVNNWGNTIVIRHLNGLYTQISHLKKGSFKVFKGEPVKRGDILALCGNSGLSPEPHVHFQVQPIPVIGAKTLDYPIAYYYQNNNGKAQLNEFSKPHKHDVLSDVIENSQLINAFSMNLNSTYSFNYIDEKGKQKMESWEVLADVFNYKFIYCSENESCAYFINDGSMFYFTSFFGSKNSLLYYFYLSAYKVFMAIDDTTSIKDNLPVSILNKTFNGVFLHDLIAPFHSFIKVIFSMKAETNSNHLDTEKIVLKSEVTTSGIGSERQISQSTITIKENTITEFSFRKANKKIDAKCVKY